MWGYTTIASQGYRHKPKLAFAIGTVRMEVWRFVTFIRVKMKAKASDS